MTSSMHLWMQHVHYGDVVTGIDETVRERASNKSRASGDEDGC
jgi:hypothetical protein